MKVAVKNAADIEQVKEADGKAKRSRKDELDDVRHVLSSPQGRRFFWRYLAILDRISAHQSGSWTYFNEGERNIVLKMKAELIAASPILFMQMEQENRPKEGELNV